MREENISTLAADWLGQFGEALASRSADDLRRLFLDDAELRDIVALTWDFATFSGVDDIVRNLIELNETVSMSGFAIDSNRTAPTRVTRVGEEVVEAIYRFETAVGTGAGIIRLVQDELGGMRARLMSTTLQELRGHEERRGARRPDGATYSRTFGGNNWQDERDERQQFADREPEVLIVGAGQAGLGLAARLGVIGVDTLVVDKLPRVGDVWRNRYHNLTLHNQSWVASFPYLDLPDTWPSFLPKDKLAGYMEYYAEAMELNIWTGTTFVGGRYDDDSAAWRVTVMRDGAEVALRPRHLVFASGTVSGEATIPQLPGLDEYQGKVLHSSGYQSADEYAGVRALVVGTGTSGHDVAQDLYSVGADVTIVQRSSTTVVSLEPSGTYVYELYSNSNSNGLPLEDADLINNATTYQTSIRSNQLMAQQMEEWDADLLDRLHAVGFRTDIGEDRTGFHLKYSRRGGGYYINVGCSDLIADKKIGLLQSSEIDRFTKGGVTLTNGESRSFDVVVFATGYTNQQEVVKKLLGSEISGRVGPIWGVDSDGEMRNMWRPTAQPGLWFHAGSLVLARSNSKYLALQIKADLEGLNPRTRAQRKPAIATAGASTTG